MASGLKEGPPPDRLYVIKNGYEIRYYTTPETFAQAIVDGYTWVPAGMPKPELAVYARCGDSPPAPQVDDILQAHPQPPPPNTQPLTLQQQIALLPPTPAQKAAYDQYNKDMKAWRKKIKTLLIPILERY